MAKKGSFSKVYDKNGDYVDVEAARFDGTRTFQMQGDVSATQTWNGDSASALTLNTSIGAKKVTTDKINDKAVQTGQIDDGAVGLTQIATNAMNGTVQDNDSKLATHAAVKTYVDAQISGQGTYLGKHTVAEINAMQTADLHNGDRVMTSDSGTINLGPGGVGFDVEAGEDLILYKSGSTVQWDSMDGNFKTKQTAVSDPTASGTGLTFIDAASQDENGDMTLSKKTVQDGTTSQKGVVQLEDSHSSTSTTKAATPNSVKEAYDLASTANSGLADKQDKPSSATENNIAVFNGSKSTKDSGKSFLPSTSTWDGTSDDKVPTAKAVQARLDLKADADKVVAIADAVVSRAGTTGWFKVAERSYNQVNATAGGTWAVTIISASKNITCHYTIDLNIRTQTSGTNAAFRIFSSSPLGLSASDNYDNFRCVLNGATGSLTIELWYYAGGAHESMMLSELATGVYTGRSTKFGWTYYNISSSTAGSETAPTGNVAKDIDFVYAQKPVANATSGNFAGLDANGLLTDSGKKAADFATAAQGSKADSAVQGVKLDGASSALTPDANKVVTIPNAAPTGTGETNGLMTAADKAKLNGITSGANKVEASNTNGNIKIDGTETNVYTHPSAGPSSATSVGDTTNQTPAFGGTFKAISQTVNTDGHTTATAEHTVTLPTDGKDLTSTVSTENNYTNPGSTATALKTLFGKIWNFIGRLRTSWQTTPDDTHFPSEKLVKDSLDAKADADSHVAIADSIISRTGQSGNGWYKVAERQFNSLADNINAIFDVFASTTEIKLAGELSFRIRSSSSSGGNISLKNYRLFSDDWTSDFKFKIVSRGLAGSCIIELWASCSTSYSGLAIAERNSSSYSSSRRKNTWTYSNYINDGGSSAPVTDATNNVVVTNVEIVYRQHNIASPTNDNLVAMDANGLVKDSGLTKSSVESAISSAGSAIQGVKVNSTALTPDANKVVNIPLATTSADGAMSAADKTKLDGIAEGAEVNVQADWDATSGDAAVLHKPFYHTYTSSNAVRQVCKVTKRDGDGSVEAIGVDFICRSSAGAIRGRLTYKKSWALFLEKCGSVNLSNSSVALYYANDSADDTKKIIYASIGAYVDLCVAPAVNLSKSYVDFSNFGTTATLPEGATEITPVWVANSASSSGTAPVKVDAYGALTAVPMDSTPTASSTNLMTSGDIKTALDGKQNTVSGATNGDIASLNASGSVVDSGLSPLLSTDTWNGTRDTKLPTEKAIENFYIKPLVLKKTSDKNVDGWVGIIQFKTSKSYINQNIRVECFSRGVTPYTIDFCVESKDGTDPNVINCSLVRPLYKQNTTYDVIGAGYTYVTNAGIRTYTLWVKIKAYCYLQCRILCGPDVLELVTPLYDAFIASKPSGYVDATVLDSRDASWINSGTFGTSRIADSAITTAKVADDAITAAKVKDNETLPVNISGSSASAKNWRGQISGIANSANTKKYVYIGRKKKSDYGCLIGMLTVCSHTDSKDVYVIGSGWSNGNFGNEATVQRISSGRTDSPIKICLYNHEVTEDGTTYSELWCYIPTGSGEADFVFRQLFNYNTYINLATGIVNQAESAFTGTLTKCANSDSRNIAYSPTNTAKGSTSVPVYVKASGEVEACTDDFARDSEVVTNVEYVAAQSGGGGNLNKTKNGSTTSVLAFMTTAEAHSLWTNAKANAS